MKQLGTLRFAAATLALLLASCGGQQPSAATGPRVMFVEPKDGQTVSSPVQVKLAAEEFIVEPAGAVAQGRGHLHIMVDADCLPVGQAIPKDDAHIHYGNGQLEATLELAPGSHRLCLQAADGAHVAIDGNGMQHTVEVTVE